MKKRHEQFSNFVLFYDSLNPECLMIQHGKKCGLELQLIFLFRYHDHLLIVPSLDHFSPFLKQGCFCMLMNA